MSFNVLGQQPQLPPMGGRWSQWGSSGIGLNALESNMGIPCNQSGFQGPGLDSFGGNPLGMFNNDSSGFGLDSFNSSWGGGLAPFGPPRMGGFGGMRPDPAVIFAQIDTNADGQVSPDEFMTFTPPAFPNGHQPPVPPADLKQQIFSRMDSNGDGQVSQDEFQNAPHPGFRRHRALDTSNQTGDLSSLLPLLLSQGDSPDGNNLLGLFSSLLGDGTSNTGGTGNDLLNLFSSLLGNQNNTENPENNLLGQLFSTLQSQTVA